MGKMRESNTSANSNFKTSNKMPSSLLKWAQNNKNNKLTNGKNKEDKNKNWIHSPESLLTGHVAYLVKFLGSTEVDQPKGIEVVKEGIRKLKFSHGIKKSEGNKTPKVELTISVDGVAVQDPKSKKIQHQYPLHRISYCADDKAEKRFFSFIAKEPDSEKHTCFVFVSDKLAEEITLTIGQAFELAYKKFLSEGKSETPEEKLSRLEHENAELRQRLGDIATLVNKQELQEYMNKNNIKELGVVGRSEVNDNTQTTNDNKQTSSLDESDVGPDDSMRSRDSDQLINLDAPVVSAKLDAMTIDDLNDDDFDPRAGDSGACSDSGEEFNPRAAAPLFSPAEKARSGPAVSSPVILPPPALPPRDPAKINAAPKAVNNYPAAQSDKNPFGAAPFSQAPSSDPFGMDKFNLMSPKTQEMRDGFSTGISFGNGEFSLDELDPLKN